jgi:periplasmic divalent cation tolerance protein
VSKKKVIARNRHGAAKNGSVVFFTTFSKKEAAVQFAQTALREKWAACLNIVEGVTSYFYWKEKLNCDSEILVIGKTNAAAFKKLKAKIKSVHPYELPELIGVSAKDGLPEYLDWIDSSLRS